ncbi:MAG: metallophosphoesterase [Magnetococcales bacterium]|nr:metallophosphoesterase [Magnetococcales bacterium]
MRTGVTIFFWLGTLAMLIAHYYLLARFGHYLQLVGRQRRGLVWLLAACVLLTVTAIPVSRTLPYQLSTWLTWLVFPWMGIVLLSLVVLGVTDAAGLLIRIAALLAPRYRSWHALHRRVGGWAVLPVIALLGSVAVWNALQPATVRSIEVTLDRLPQQLDGLKMVQLTDLHIGPMIDGRWLRKIVDDVNALQPDLVAITGDLVDGSVEVLRDQVAPIADLKAPLGVYFVTGNHEYYSGVEAWCRHLASLGVQVLSNRHVSVAVRNAVVDIAGVEDWHSRQLPHGGHDLPKAMAGHDPDRMLILLAHQPATIHEAANHGVDLQLSGHTHGGQIWPFGYLVYLQQPYVSGLHRHPGTRTHIYISSGTGFWGPPMRLATTAEVTKITLRSVAMPCQSC